jgi:hypothetical protein
MWTYSDTTGEFRHDGDFISKGYSGFGPGKNAPLLGKERNIGPIPAGKYSIGPAHFHPKKGPVVMALTPLAGTETFGRSGFLIHGDSKEHPGEASHGCIILARDVREQVASSDDKSLEVIL